MSYRIRTIPTDARTLFQRGPAIDVYWFVPGLLKEQLEKQGRPVSPPIAGPVLVDTGATLSCIGESTAARLGLKPVTTRKTGGVHGERESNVYYVGMLIPLRDVDGLTGRSVNKIAMMTGVPDIEERSKNYAQMVNPATGEKVGFTGLIGRDFLSHMQLSYDGEQGSFELVLRASTFDGLPKGDHIDL